ncbi:MAG: rRNA synthase [Acidobacteriota bacterium]|jgi:23S rRNA pseudouridine1911/1915/1917 synthase|nr:rRNA synthase [Acidobacteriota bacterium]
MSEDVSDEVLIEPEAEALTFEVSEEDTGARLDAFLAARIEGVSRTTLKRAIDDGDVLVGGLIAKPSHKLKAGEHVEVELPAPPQSEVTPEDLPIEILYEDDEVVVVNKAAGMVVHPAAGVQSGTLAGALAFHFRQLSRHAGSLRPGIVHRLDRDTSGAIVVAKTAQAHENLADQFRARTVFKSYVALVHGVVKDEKGKIEAPLARDPRNRTRMAVVRGGRAALSLWRVRQRFERMTLLDVQIKTGRTHQIRVHLAWMKHPVVADETYGGGRDKTLADPALRARVRALGRQFLHAERLGFHHPRTGEWLSLTAPLPRDLTEFLEALDSTPRKA